MSESDGKTFDAIEALRESADRGNRLWLQLGALEAQLAAKDAQLAECYRLTGADPDGDEDWRLAPRAVEEVKRLRQESDEADAQLIAKDAMIERLMQALTQITHCCANPESVLRVARKALAADATKEGR